MNESIVNPNLTETKTPPNRHTFNFLFKVFCVVLFVLATEFCLYILIRKEFEGYVLKSLKSEACKSELVNIFQNLDNRVLSRPRRGEKPPDASISPGKPGITDLPGVHGSPGLPGPTGPNGARRQLRLQGPLKSGIEGSTITFDLNALLESTRPVDTREQWRLQDSCQSYRANKDYYSGLYQMIWKETPKKEFSLDFLVIGSGNAIILLAENVSQINFTSYEIYLSTNYSSLYLRPDVQKNEESKLISKTYDSPKSPIVRSYSIRVWDGDHIEIKLEEESILKWEGPHKFDLKYLLFGSNMNMLFVYGCKGNTVRFIS